ncbi:MAG: hypothetical protein HYZ40_17340 [Rhodospirillales bacterium]|nr:hypothetical protein [Rhodospirillales bacterium]
MAWQARTTAALFFGLVLSSVVVFWSSGAKAEDCNGVVPEVWLSGTWEAAVDLQTMVIRRAGGSLVWTYDRKAGVTSERWGDKVAAAGSGTVEALDGCRAVLKGQYTRFDGSGQRGRPTVGSAMEWKFLQTAPGVVASEGLGYGRETFRLRWTKVP